MQCNPGTDFPFFCILWHVRVPSCLSFPSCEMPVHPPERRDLSCNSSTCAEGYLNKCRRALQPLWYPPQHDLCYGRPHSLAFKTLKKCRSHSKGDSALLVLCAAWRSKGLSAAAPHAGDLPNVSLPLPLLFCFLPSFFCSSPQFLLCVMLLPCGVLTHLGRKGGKFLESPSNDQSSKRHLWLLLALMSLNPGPA